MLVGRRVGRQAPVRRVRRRPVRPRPPRPDRQVRRASPTSPRSPPPVGQVRLRLARTRTAYADLRGATAVRPGQPASARRRSSPRSGPTRCAPTPTRRAPGTGSGAASAPIGDLLMDQAVLAGVGNVYRAEVLFRHRIHPLRPGKHPAGRPVAGDVGRPGRADARGRARPGASTPCAPSTRPRRWAARRGSTTTAARSTSTGAPASRASSAARKSAPRCSPAETCSGVRDVSPGSARAPYS